MASPIAHVVAEVKLTLAIDNQGSLYGDEVYVAQDVTTLQDTAPFVNDPCPDALSLAVLSSIEEWAAKARNRIIRRSLNRNHKPVEVRLNENVYTVKK
jgi:hypothetical protein